MRAPGKGVGVGSGVGVRVGVGVGDGGRGVGVEGEIASTIGDEGQMSLALHASDRLASMKNSPNIFRMPATINDNTRSVNMNSCCLLLFSEIDTI
jgi:hypothetical protein